MESDWPRRNKSHYVTEIVSWLGFADVIFGGDKQQPEICLCLQATAFKVSAFFSTSNRFGSQKNMEGPISKKIQMFKVNLLYLSSVIHNNLSIYLHLITLLVEINIKSTNAE